MCVCVCVCVCVWCLRLTLIFLFVCLGGEALASYPDQLMGSLGTTLGEPRYEAIYECVNPVKVYYTV